uniref:Uncharacterized protein n=1 Tax=Oryza nivara TaxID=4536 RepID=A0A0E0HF21_ORYNI
MENEVVKSEGQLRWHMVSSSSSAPPPPSCDSSSSSSWELPSKGFVWNTACVCAPSDKFDTFSRLELLRKPECIEVLSSSSSSSIIIIQFCRSLETCFSASIEGCRISQPKMKNKVVKSEGHLHTLITAL